MHLLLKGCLVSSSRQLSYYEIYVKQNLILVLEGFCSQCDSGKYQRQVEKNINFHNYFSILSLNIILVTFVWMLPLTLMLVSPSGNVFMYVSYVQHHQIRLLMLDSCVLHVRRTGAAHWTCLGEPQLYFLTLFPPLSIRPAVNIFSVSREWGN